MRCLFRLRNAWNVTLFWVIGCAFAPVLLQAQTAPFVAPPRTIADITAILDQEKPDPAAMGKLQASANRMAPAGASKAALAEFYYQRGQARVQIGHDEDALADSEAAVELKRVTVELRDFSNYEQLAVITNDSLGRNKKALEILLAMAEEYDRPETQALLVNTFRLMTRDYIAAGDLGRADVYLQKQQAVMSDLRKSPNYGGYLRATLESNSDATLALMAKTRGQFGEAEDKFRAAEAWMREALRIGPGPSAPPVTQLQQVADNFLSELGAVKAQQGRTAEAEADVRRALLNSLNANGKYNLQTLRVRLKTSSRIAELS
jgi:tetratricopeptide (TPR) repeat protein